MRRCPTCQIDIVDDAAAYCDSCGFDFVTSPSTSNSDGSVVNSAREPGIIIGGIGLLLLIFGALRWNSAESQLARAFGQTDGLGIMLLLGGGIGLVLGLYLGFAIIPAPVAPVSPKSVEERIRQLNGLRSNNLITDVEYDQRKREILASL
jgi:hypothetical protein